MKENSKARVMVVQVCEECGTEFPIWRRKSRLKDDDHIKHLYCPTCRKVTAHKQRREW